MDPLGTYEAFVNHPTSLTFSPDGATFASGHRDGTIRLWDVATRAITKIMEGHRRDIESVSFSPDAGTLASASADGTVKLWNVATGRTLVTVRGSSQPMSVAFSQDGAALASGWWDGTVKLIEVTDGKISSSFVGHGDNVNAVSFDPRGGGFATASRDGTVKLWDLATGNASTLFGHSGPIWGMAFSPDGITLASRSGTSQGKVEIWDAVTGRMIASLGEQRCSPV